MVELEALVENKYFSGEFRGIVTDYEKITKFGIEVLWPFGRLRFNAPCNTCRIL